MQNAELGSVDAHHLPPATFDLQQYNSQSTLTEKPYDRHPRNRLERISTRE